MNILWIEDFGGGLEPSTATLESMFKNLLSFVDDWDEDELNLIKRPTDLKKFCEQQKSVHRIHLSRNYFDYIAFKSAHSITHEIDTIILDIRLDNITAEQFNLSIPDAYLSDKRKFHENGGFYIFNDLIHLGVPAERICFMTGEKNSFKGFEEKCTEIYTPKITAFEKSDADYEKLRDWLTAQQSSYAILRRGIIDGCDKLAETTDPELKEYFSGLKRYLLLREPKPAERDSEYLHLARAIVHDWDKEKVEALKEKKGQIYGGLGWVLTNARNWLSHASLLKIANEKLIAFLFLINARMLVNFTSDELLEDFEQELLALFTINDDTETKITINLKNFYKEISTICEQKSIEFIGRYYSKIVNNFHEKKVTECNYYTLLFRCFMFTVYRQHFSYPKANTNNPISPILDYQVKFVKTEPLPLYLQEFTTRFYPLAI